MKYFSNNLIGTKSKPHVHNANWPINIKLLEDHPIPKITKLSFPAHNTTSKLPKLAIFHNLKLKEKREVS